MRRVFVFKSQKPQLSHIAQQTGFSKLICPIYVRETPVSHDPVTKSLVQVPFQLQKYCRSNSVYKPFGMRCRVAYNAVKGSMLALCDFSNTFAHHKELSPIFLRYNAGACLAHYACNFKTDSIFIRRYPATYTLQTNAGYVITVSADNDKLRYKLVAYYKAASTPLFSYHTLKILDTYSLLLHSYHPGRSVKYLRAHYILSLRSHQQTAL